MKILDIVITNNPERSPYSITVFIPHQDMSIRNHVTGGTSSALWEDPETGWILKSIAKPEVNISDKIFYIKGWETGEPFDRCRATFRNADELAIFKKFVQKVLNHFNPKVKKEKLNMGNGKPKESRFITINLDTLTNPAKRRIVQKMISDGDGMLAIQYLRSLEGLPPTDRIETGRIKTSGVDKLAKEAGYYVKLYNKRYNPFEDHKPSSHPSEYGKYMGIEIECLIPCTEKYSSPSQFGKWLSKEKKKKTIKITDDGSLRPPANFFGIEFRLLTKCDEMSNLKQLCDVLRTLGAKVNRSCGLHVHLDMRTEDEKKGVDNVNLKGRRIGNALEILKDMVPSSRRSNSYCKLEVGSVDSSDRYYAVNRSSYSRHKTLEVRLHSGTVNYKKISNWCKLMFTLSNSVKMTKNRPKTAEELFDLLELDESMREYILSRIEEFKKSADDETDERPPMEAFIWAVGQEDSLINVDSNFSPTGLSTTVRRYVRESIGSSRHDTSRTLEFRVDRIARYILDSLQASGDRLYSARQRDVQEYTAIVRSQDDEYFRMNGRFPESSEDITHYNTSRSSVTVSPSLRPISYEYTIPAASSAPNTGISSSQMTAQQRQAIEQIAAQTYSINGSGQFVSGPPTRNIDPYVENNPIMDGLGLQAMPVQTNTDDMLSEISDLFSDEES